MALTIDSLQIEVGSSAKSAQDGLEQLKKTLSGLKRATGKGLGLSTVVSDLKSISSEASKVSTTGIERLEKALTSFGMATKGLKISSSIGNQIKSISEAINGTKGTSYETISQLGTALRSLQGLEGIRVSSSIGNQIPKIAAAMEGLDGISYDSIGRMVEGLKPLETLGKTNLSNILTSLKKLPDTMEALEAIDLQSFASKVEAVTAALTPLANAMNQVSNGFTGLPGRIRSVGSAMRTVPSGTGNAARSYGNLAAKAGLAYVAVRTIGNTIANWIGQTNDYIENMNLFNVSMGEYAQQAQNYAMQVGDTLGINPSEWMRNQGVFMNLATGFGVVGDRAYTMSQNLTQLGYDISSFFNIPIEESMQKLQSGISGEIEPLTSAA